MITEKIITNALGFPITLTISVLENLRPRGRHVTHEQEGLVPASAEHRIEIKKGLPPEEVPEVIAHECYHLFCAVHHLIACDEETAAEVFGHLVKRIHALYEKAQSQ
jgi:hypothetical protein